METNLKFNSAICTSREQSERLLALGLKKETADMVWSGLSENPICHSYKRIKRLAYDLNDKVHPAWSLHRLLCLLPTEYTYDIDFQQIMREFVFGSKDMYDEVISCIETLINEGYFYEEYLEEHLCGKR